MRRATWLLVLLLALAGVSGAQETKKPQGQPARPGATKSPLTPIGSESEITNQVYLGELAPDFELDGSRGRPMRLLHQRGYWVILIFADSRQSLVSMKGIEADMRKLGVHAFGICADKAHVLKGFAEREHLQSLLLSDVTGEISQMYGLYDRKARTIRPGFVILDRQGIVRTALLGQAVPMDQVLEMVKNTVSRT